MKKTIFAAGWALMLTSAANAEAIKSYTASELVARAIERNPELKALDFEADAERSRAVQAGFWEDPTLELGGEKKTEPVGDTNFGRIGLSQTISKPGRLRAREEAARKMADLANVNGEASRIELRGQVLELIYEFRVAHEKANHSQERLRRLKTVETYLKSRTFAAPQRKAEASIVRSKLLVLEKENSELEATESAAWNSLNTYLGFGERIEVSAPWYTTGQNLDFKELEHRAQERNPDLKRQSLQVQLRESEFKAAEADRWPGLTVSASFSNGSGASPEKNYGLGISLPLPMWNGNRGNIDASKASMSAAENRLDWARSRMTANLKSALDHYKASLLTLSKLSFDKMGSFERDMTEIDASFKRGQVDLITYLEADAQHFESLNAALDAQVEYVSNLRKILLLVGDAPAAPGK